jgi:hypothetical protein
MGFSMAVPDGWKRLVKPPQGEVDFISPDGLDELVVSVLDYAPPSPLQHWQDLQKVLEARNNGYSLWRMNATKTRVGGIMEDAAIWEWTWMGSDRRFHAIDLGFGKEGGMGYAVYLSAPDDDWENQKPEWQVAVNTFRPNPAS